MDATCPTTSIARFSSVSAAVTASPRRYQKTHSMPPEKQEVFKSMESWATTNVLPLLKPVRDCWQPQTFLPDSALPSEEFNDEVKALRERTAEQPDDYFVVLVGDMITEEALPTYQSMINTLDGVRDETGTSCSPWVVWTRAWTVDRHGDLLKKGVDMFMIERTVQYLIGAGTDPGTENNPYLGFVYTSFQERATFISHGKTARLAKEGGDPSWHAYAAQSRRTRNATNWPTQGWSESYPTGAMLAIADMMKKRITMPAHLIFDGEDPRLFDHFSFVAQRIGAYRAEDYADIVEALNERWGWEKLEGLTDQGREAQEFVSKLAPRIRKLQERADERAKEMGASSCEVQLDFQ